MALIPCQEYTRTGRSFHRVHQQVKQLGNAWVKFLIPPDSLRFDTDVHLPAVHARYHQVGLVVIEEFPAGGLPGFSSPVVKLVVSIQMDLVGLVAHFVTGKQFSLVAELRYRITCSYVIFLIPLHLKGAVVFR